MYKSVSRFMKRTGIKVGRLGAPKFGSKTRKKAKSKRRQKGKKIKSFIGGPIRRLRRALQIKVVCPQGCGFSAPKRELLEHIRAIHGIDAGLHPWRDKNRTPTPTEIRVDIFYPANAEAQANQAAQILKDLGGSVQSTMVMSSPTAIQQFGHLYYFPGAGGNLSQAGKNNRCTCAPHEIESHQSVARTAQGLSICYLDRGCEGRYARLATVIQKPMRHLRFAVTAPARGKT